MELIAAKESDAMTRFLKPRLKAMERLLERGLKKTETLTKSGNYGAFGVAYNCAIARRRCGGAPTSMGIKCKQK